MKAELILDEDSLKEVLKHYMYGKLNGNTGCGSLPIHPENITAVKVVPKIKSIKVFFEYKSKESK